jgi:hypothetical protein
LFYQDIIMSQIDELEAVDWVPVIRGMKMLNISRESLYGMVERGILSHRQIPGVRGIRLALPELQRISRASIKPATARKERKP